MVRAEEAEDARIGTWLEPPGKALMAHLIELDIDFIAEDLGLVTDRVIDLRQQHGLMGMAVHQFGFDRAPNAPHSPAMTPEDVVAYSGTHDNDTTNGWWASTSDDVRKEPRRQASTLLTLRGVWCASDSNPTHGGTSLHSRTSWVSVRRRG